MESEKALLEAIKVGIHNISPEPFRIKISLNEADLTDAKLFNTTEDYIYEKMVKYLRPDTSKMSRVEKEITSGRIPDSIIEKIDKIEVYHTIEEDTFKPKASIHIYMKPEFDNFYGIKLKD